MRVSGGARAARIGAVALVIVAASAVALAASRIRRVEVHGDSMEPALREGDRLLVLRGARMRPGDVVALDHPGHPGLVAVKRLAALPGDELEVDGRLLAAGDGVLVLGDNPARSTDSREFGAVPVTAIRGRVIHRYAPPERRGPIPAP